MVGKCAFLFPGQGAQTPGMAIDLWEKYDAVKKLFALANEAFHTDAVSLLRDSSPDELKKTEIAQPSIVLAELAAWTVLLERGIAPVAAAGHSLGEYSALAAAGVIDRETCLRLVFERGTAMAEAVKQAALTNDDVDGEMNGNGNGSGMAAVIGLPLERVESLVAAWTAEGLAGLYSANLNSPRQTVVSGTSAALKEAEARFKEAGAKRVILLAVGGPFHSPLMRSAADRFARTLAGIAFADPSIPFFSDVTGKRETDGAEIKRLATEQITSAVRWTDIEAGVAALQVDAVLEPGPGKTLCGLWKDTGSAIPCYAAGSDADIEQIMMKN
ncbi:MAG: ACP S-malonyltransferase [Spirochaetaceae bacterium]|jgi:[acyl-carrier-protein] S-malonyltransferase|nr:ACP S-malonyltransferase [Spirochaetaceae bacterium]